MPLANDVCKPRDARKYTLTEEMLKIFSKYRKIKMIEPNNNEKLQKGEANFVEENDY